MRKHRFNANILDTFYEFPEATQPRAGVCRKWERIVQFGRCFATIEVPVIAMPFPIDACVLFALQNSGPPVTFKDYYRLHVLRLSTKNSGRTMFIVWRLIAIALGLN